MLLKVIKSYMPKVTVKNASLQPTQETVEKPRNVILLTITNNTIYGKHEIKMHPYDKMYFQSHLEGISYYQQTSQKVEHFILNGTNAKVCGDNGEYDRRLFGWRVKNLFRMPSKGKVEVSKVWPNIAEVKTLFKNGKEIHFEPPKEVELARKFEQIKAKLGQGKRTSLLEEDKSQEEGKILKFVINGAGSYDVLNPPMNKPIYVAPSDRTIGGIKVGKIIDFLVENIEKSNAKEVKITLNSCMSGRIRESDGTSLTEYIQNKLEDRINGRVSSSIFSKFKKRFSNRVAYSEDICSEKNPPRITVKGVNGFMLPYVLEIEDLKDKDLSNKNPKGEKKLILQNIVCSTRDGFPNFSKFSDEEKIEKFSTKQGNKYKYAKPMGKNSLKPPSIAFF